MDSIATPTPSSKAYPLGLPVDVSARLVTPFTRHTKPSGKAVPYAVAINRIREADVPIAHLRTLEYKSDEYDAAKDGLPGFIFAGQFKGGQKKDKGNLVKASGVVMVELDGLDGVDHAPGDVRARYFEAHPFLSSAMISAGGRGVHLHAVVDPVPESDKDYKAAWKAVMDALGLTDTGDKAVKNINRLSYLTSDPDLRTRLEAVHPLRWKAIEGEETAPTPSPTGRHSGVLLAALEHVHPPQEDYNEYLGWLITIKTAGLTMADADRWARKGAKYREGEIGQRWEGLSGDETPDEARSRIRKAARGHGWQDPDYRPQPSGEAPPTLDSADIAFAVRLLEALGDKALLIEHPKGLFDLRIDRGNGVWREHRGHVLDVHAEAVTKWVEGRRGTVDVRAWKEKAAIDKEGASVTSVPALKRILDAAGGAYMRKQRKDRAWADRIKLTYAMHTEVDAQLDYLGAPNGVIDLRDEGRLLKGQEARSKLITRQIADPYDPNATHPAVDKLFSHLDKQDREWMLNVLGFALHGRPSRRFYVLEGKTGGEGKGTLLEAIGRTLGDYHATIPEQALIKNRVGGSSASPEKAFATRSRISTLNEDFGPNTPWNINFLKQVSGGDSIQDRGLYKDFNWDDERNSTSTMVLAVNALPKWDRKAQALADREGILPYPKPPIPDPTLRPLWAVNVKARQALMALLVRHAAAAGDKPPEDSDKVRVRREEAHDEAIGTTGQWLRRVLVQDDRFASVFAADILEEARKPEDEGGAGDPTITQDTLNERVRLLFNLPQTKMISRKGIKRRGWRGIRLLPVEDRPDEAEDISGAELPATPPLHPDLVPDPKGEVDIIPARDSGPPSDGVRVHGVRFRSVPEQLREDGQEAEFDIVSDPPGTSETIRNRGPKAAMSQLWEQASAEAAWREVRRGKTLGEIAKPMGVSDEQVGEWAAQIEADYSEEWKTRALSTHEEMQDGAYVVVDDKGNVVDLTADEKRLDEWMDEEGIQSEVDEE